MIDSNRALGLKMGLAKDCINKHDTIRTTNVVFMMSVCIEELAESQKQPTSQK